MKSFWIACFDSRQSALHDVDPLYSLGQGVCYDSAIVARLVLMNIFLTVNEHCGPRNMKVVEMMMVPLVNKIKCTLVLKCDWRLEELGLRGLG